MFHKLTSPPDQSGALILRPFFAALWVYGLLFWFIARMTVLLMDDTSVFKSYVLGPMIGSSPLVDVLSFLNLAWFLLLGFQAWRLWRQKSSPRWRAFGVLAFGLALVVGMQLAVQGLTRTASIYDNDRILSDKEMIREFKKRNEGFNQLVVEIKRDLARGPEDEAFNHRALEALPGTDQVNWWNWMLDPYQKTGIMRGVQTDSAGQRIHFTKSVRAIGERGTFKGYLYAESPPSPLATNLDAIASDGAGLEIYRRIEGPWFLFLRQR